MAKASPVSRTVALAALTIATMSCGSGTAPDTSAGAARTELPRALSGQEQQVKTAANAFSFALWQKLNTAQADANIFASPLSASFALGMTPERRRGNDTE